jgi:ATP-binding cassette subfamily B protein
MALEIREKEYGILDLLAIPFRCNWAAAGFILLQRVLLGLVPTVQVIATAAFIDGVLDVYWGKGELADVYGSLLVMVALVAYNRLIWRALSLAGVRLDMGYQAGVRTAVTAKRSRLAYHHIEDAETWDLLNRVSNDGQTQILGGFNSLLTLGSSIIHISGLVVLLFSQVWWAPLLILVFSIPLFALGIKGGRATYEVNREVSKYRRRHEYLGEVLLSREAVEERALFGYGEALNEKWNEFYEKARVKQYQTQRKWYIRMKTGSVITAITSFLIVLVLLNPVLTGVISVGMFISLVNAVFGLVQVMSWDFTMVMDQLARSREFLKDLTEFAKLEETPGAVELPARVIPEFSTLEFKDVCFSYPGTEKMVLDKLSFRLDAGRNYAFVGVNGAGKTTIIKLMTGLYQNYSGEILLNGRELRTYSPSELKAFFNVFYQDFSRYYIPLGDNIALGDVNHGYDLTQIKEVVAQLDLDDVVSKLPEGLDTPLGRIKEGGQDISGGEWQRVAMGRAVYNPAPVRILDEPTAALDPIAESRLYQQFEQISQGKTTVLISHRLGSTKLADHIFVIDGGTLAEAGSHGELMEQGGLYREMYESQRGWYS